MLDGRDLPLMREEQVGSCLPMGRGHVCKDPKTSMQTELSRKDGRNYYYTPLQRRPYSYPMRFELLSTQKQPELAFFNEQIGMFSCPLPLINEKLECPQQEAEGTPTTGLLIA